LYSSEDAFGSADLPLLNFSGLTVHDRIATAGPKKSDLDFAPIVVPPEHDAASRCGADDRRRHTIPEARREHRDESACAATSLRRDRGGSIGIPAFCERVESSDLVQGPLELMRKHGRPTQGHSPVEHLAGFSVSLVASLFRGCHPDLLTGL